MKSINRVENTIQLYKDCVDRLENLNKKENRTSADASLTFNVISIQFSTIQCLYILFNKEIFSKFGYIEIETLHPTNMTAEFSFKDEILPFIENCLLEEQLGISLEEKTNLTKKIVKV